jgi:hypothetical protein
VGLAALAAEGAVEDKREIGQADPNRIGEGLFNVARVPREDVCDDSIRTWRETNPSVYGDKRSTLRGREK